MQSKPVLVSLLLILTQGNGELFDFHVISRRQSFHAGEILCQNLGYDGLAVINSPEMFAYALRISRTVRATGHGLYLGLRNSTDTNLFTWDDGTFPAQDEPWVPDSINRDFTYSHYGVLSNIGYLRLFDTYKKYAICGNHENLPTEAHGVTKFGQQPTNVGSILSNTKAVSYLECVLLCGQDHRCRMAEFNFDLLTCMTLESVAFVRFIPNKQFQTFVRNGFF
ncbi:hypothetical protein RRG08_042032 [Elysia crispata]|uniref:Apple domain-containing protein n=1 Tax=Elysia crispata TaxID=231223 RepID=A0AAE0Z8H4_9GAST|nr:hypothetical protein RRG08_042032 [Elysia crispata]